ncbi:helix-turn-helix domain-containing protein [Palleronia marisminoris]|uniref:helix-turn-helix domain-containing protein n=1 Tax=Palleronia marisminoris TaxID=315423 RepID=UPI001FDFB49B|nr:LysR family transcriptional regulator [Palleronia marisminoris]
MRVLDAIFREGLTLKSVASLGLSRSALSGRLSRLRHSLADPLFIRQANKPDATDYAPGVERACQAGARTDRRDTFTAGSLRPSDRRRDVPHCAR